MMENLLLVWKFPHGLYYSRVLEFKIEHSILIRLSNYSVMTFQDMVEYSVQKMSVEKDMVCRDL